MSGNFRITLRANNKHAEENFEMSKIELEAHFPKQIEMLQNSPCSAVQISCPDGGFIIEKSTKID